MRFSALARAYALFPFGWAFCVGDDFYIYSPRAHSYSRHNLKIFSTTLPRRWKLSLIRYYTRNYKFKTNSAWGSWPPPLPRVVWRRSQREKRELWHARARLISDISGSRPYFKPPNWSSPCHSVYYSSSPFWVLFGFCKSIWTKMHAT